VATDIGGLRTAVRAGGLRVAGHDAGEWAAALTRAIQTRESLSPAAVAHARRFSWSATADGLLATYREALAARSGLLLAAR
jgi:D-inositol-3-phosphate glycosyltransferase